MSQDLQKLFEYVEDADLWKWKLPDSKAFHAGPLAHTLSTLEQTCLHDFDWPPCALNDECHGLGCQFTNLLHCAAGLGSQKLEYDANKNPAIFQQLCALQLNRVIQQASKSHTAYMQAVACYLLIHGHDMC